jgi:predicted metal-dependent phosphotriesterase family hydrolase
MMANGLLEKFPGIRFYFVHSKASWLHLFLEKAEGYLWLSTQEDPVSLAPDKVFETRETLITLGRDESAVWATPDLFEDLGAWGSFYPNHDTYPPSDCVRGLRAHGVNEQTIANVMGENAARVFGIDLKAQQPAG